VAAVHGSSERRVVFGLRDRVQIKVGRVLLIRFRLD
jgi:hypothetical protein